MTHQVLRSTLFASLCVGAVYAGDLSQAYFAATEPGSWARYETSTSAGATTAATYTRLTDDARGFVVEIQTEFVEGPGTGGQSTSIFKLSPDFDWQQRFLSFGKALTGATFVMEGRPPMHQPERMVAAMRESMADFADGFEAKGAATHGGVECDVYAFDAVLGGPNPGTMSGEICLSATVPFALVHQSATMSNQQSGESSFETLLVDSGSGAPRVAPVQAADPAPDPGAKRLNIALAYQRGVIALDFRVPANTDGRVLELALTNLGDEPVVIAAGTSTYAFEVGLPIGTLYFAPVYEQDIELAPGATSDEFHTSQMGDRGVREGSFRLVMKQGVPTLSGEMKVGKIKQSP